MTSTKRGRPRAFDKDLALEKALHVFIEKGYEGASLDDLTHAMGINKPSMYSAFGNKEELFFKVLKIYTEPNRQALREILFSAPNTYEAFLTLFQGMAQRFTGSKNCQEKMAGCLVTNSTILSCRGEQSLSSQLTSIHNSNEELFYERLELGRQEGDLAPTTDIRALAQYFNGILAGMGVVARAQQSDQALNNIATTAVQILKPSE